MPQNNDLQGVTQTHGRFLRGYTALQQRAEKSPPGRLVLRPRDGKGTPTPPAASRISPAGWSRCPRKQRDRRRLSRVGRPAEPVPHARVFV